jgi:NAD(P)H-dependent FMN reductase
MEPMIETAAPAVIPLERWTQEDRAIVDPSGRVAATLRTQEEARRVVAALNAVAGMPTEVLEGFTTGVINDPIQELAAQLGAMVEFVPRADERRSGERRQWDRRRAVTEVRIEARP